jgi:hypothetical protein
MAGFDKFFLTIACLFYLERMFGYLFHNQF